MVTHSPMNPNTSPAISTRLKLVIKKASIAGIYSSRLAPLVRSEKQVEKICPANATPITIPRFLAVAMEPEAIPLRFMGILFIMTVLLGEI